MSHIQQFSGIDDYVKAANLNVDNKYPDFLIYDYEKANPDACKHLPTFR